MGRSNSLPDVGASARALADIANTTTGEDAVAPPSCFVPVVLRRICRPRVTVFALLERGLGQSFSLDNGLAVQTVLEFWQRHLCRHFPDGFCVLLLLTHTHTSTYTQVARPPARTPADPQAVTRRRRK